MKIDYGNKREFNIRVVGKTKPKLKKVSGYVFKFPDKKYKNFIFTVHQNGLGRWVTSDYSVGYSIKSGGHPTRGGSTSMAFKIIDEYLNSTQILKEAIARGLKNNGRANEGEI